MEVYSKYNINDTVWVVSRNKVIQQKIQGIEITATAIEILEQYQRMIRESILIC